MNNDLCTNFDRRDGFSISCLGRQTGQCLRITGRMEAVPISPASPADLLVIADQLGRQPRGVVGVAWRCPCGRPAVVATAPRLEPDGEPFPTTYYLTCPRAVSACSRLEAVGLMSQMSLRLLNDAKLKSQYQQAHAAYLNDRSHLAAQHGVCDVPDPEVSAGGMPDRVKCLHALVGHALAAGPGINPLGDEALTEIGAFWNEPCQIGDES